MNINSDLQDRIEQFLDENLVSVSSVGGGCIADSRIIKTVPGNTYFLKTRTGTQSMFIKEANGLKELSKPNSIRIPKVVLAEEDFLLLENIHSGSKSGKFFEDFGHSFAKLHQYKGESFGFFEDNFIGATPQVNRADGDEIHNWPEFYYQKRIVQQLRYSEKNGYATPELISLVSQLENKIKSILGGSEESPTLLHGDLWAGNFMCDESGKAVLIDPAVYYGHREADLAMTKMFGGFTHDFYIAYQETFPLSAGWEYRENLYLLYHYMNHLNLFGNSYYGPAIRILKHYIE